jgi:NAD(P)-dependent dehydrogenase (short-subunit alcohol dehydrogenase family)
MNMKNYSGEIEPITFGGKVALISGAASGIGLAITQRMAKAGANVALIDVDERRGKQVSGDLRALRIQSKFYLCDVSQSSDCRKTVSEVLEDFEKIDILVNNAGIILRKDIVELSEDEWDKVMNTNLKSVYLLSHSVIPSMVEHGGGSIINIGSGWGLKGGAKAAVYCAAKGGMVNLTRAMAIDHGNQNIRVNCVCPGDTETELLRKEAEQLSLDFETLIREAAKRPLPRIGSPNDVANAVLFLASEMSNWVTGSVLVVDGGGLA